MEGLLIIAFISMCGVLGNFFLQTYWFYWSHKIQERKHFTDEAQETKRIVELFDEEYLKRKKEWINFTPPSNSPEEAEPVASSYEFPPVYKTIKFDDVDKTTYQHQHQHQHRHHPEKKRKYNPDDIDGALDNFFNPKENV